MLTRKQISRVAELRFASELTKKGWDIFLPYGEDNPIDILCHKRGKYLRVQVKATKPKDNAISCKLRSTNNWQNKKYSKKDIDCFGIYDYKNRKGYMIPIKEVEGMSEIRIRLKKPKNNQKKKIRYAKRYFFFE